MNTTRNIALAATLPDGDRPSYVRCRTGAPLSEDLAQDALRVREFAEDIAAGMMTREQLVEKLVMLSDRLAKHERAAVALEDCAARVLEASHG